MNKDVILFFFFFFQIHCKNKIILFIKKRVKAQCIAYLKP